MQTASSAPRGIKAGGLASSKWAASSSSSSSTSTWTSRGSSAYAPRTSAAPRETSAITPAVQWWETPNPAPKLRVSPPPPPSSASTAAATATATQSAAGLSAAQRELRRYVQIVRRMKWKLPYLQDGYRRAITGEDDAELMFKLDFYEYYMLLERALVHLLGVFGVVVSREGPGPGPRPAPANGVGGGSTHRYHQNVLAALERAGGPLREALGSGEVRAFLGRAKDLRNRWKYAEENGDAGGDRGGRAPLESYDLDSMFWHIFAGFDEGYIVAEAWVAELASRADMVLSVADGEGGASEMRVDGEEEEFDFMVDAMDWEAV